MSEGGRGEREQHTFSSAFTLECSIIVLEVKPSTPVCICLNKRHQEITADLRITTVAGAAGEKGVFQLTRTICVLRKLAARRPVITSPSNTPSDVICRRPHMHALSLNGPQCWRDTNTFRVVL